MARGGDAYLAPTRVYEKLLKFKGDDFALLNLKQLEEDLDIMKGFAKIKAKDLAANYSMLDVEEAGIEHLTCTKIENDELPWNGGADNLIIQ